MTLLPTMLEEALDGLRGTILSALERRFPRLADERRARLENIRSFDALRYIIAEIVVARRPRRIINNIIDRKHAHDRITKSSGGTQ